MYWFDADQARCWGLVKDGNIWDRASLTRSRYLLRAGRADADAWTFTATALTIIASLTVSIRHQRSEIAQMRQIRLRCSQKMKSMMPLRYLPFGGVPERHDPDQRPCSTAAKNGASNLIRDGCPSS